MDSDCAQIIDADDKKSSKATVTRFQLCKYAKKEDRKSTRLNSSHSQISYAVFCLKKKKADEMDQMLKGLYQNNAVNFNTKLLNLIERNSAYMDGSAVHRAIRLRFIVWQRTFLYEV